MASETLTNPMDFKVRELLKEVQLDYSPSFTKLVDETVSAIRETIHQIPEDLHVCYGRCCAGFCERDIGADKVEFKFKKPKSIEIGGSYSMRCTAKPDVNVDLFVRMPKECFHEKDYLNYRYHAKRFLYLCIVKKYLKLSSVAQKVEWSTFQNEARKPILVVHPGFFTYSTERKFPSGTVDMKLVESPQLLVRIIPTATSVFNVSKLNLDRNNFRALNQGGVLQATLKYNSSILEDLFLEDNAEFVKRTFLGWKELGEALILLKVWARQRSSIYVHDCLNGFLISVIMAYLATKSGRNRINNSMTMMQIFRVTMDFIATSKLWDNGLFFQHQGEQSTSKESRISLKSFPVVICGPFADFTLTFRMTRSGFLELRDEAALTLSCIDKCGDGGFDEVFMTRIDFPAKYDYCIREPLLIGISVSTLEKALRVVDIGPNAENKDEALKFRKFWGDKADLRRFKDGTIAESTVWDCKHWERHLIIRRIVDHVLVRHLSLSKENITTIVDQLDFSLLYGSEDPIAFSASLLEAFEVLSKRLRLLNDIPLRVSSVQPLDSAFRFTSVFPPRPHPLAVEKSVNLRLQKLTSSCIHPLELEGSGNWPMDEVAIEKTKSAFLLKIGESLQNNWGMTCNATEDDVVVFTSGYAFRLKILHERGLSLLKRQIGSNQVKWVPSTDKILSIRGQHSSMINGLQGRFPIYGQVVRLAKRWVAAHFFSTSLEEEAVELLTSLVAGTGRGEWLLGWDLTFGHGWVTHIMTLGGFLRFLSEYDWAFSALIVDINGDLTVDDEKEINGNFTSSRKAYDENMQNTSPAVFLATSYDKASEAWTKSSPSSLELKRLVAYARSSADLLSKLILHDQPESYKWECLYRTPLSKYNAVVLLHRDKLPYPQRLLFPSELNQGRHVVRGSASKDFHPFILPGEMNGSKLFPDTFKVWYDSLGGDAIGLTWEGLGSKVSKKRGREVGEGEDDFLDVLKNVGEAGKGFVRSIYFLKAPRLCN
ncbi:hypothetical protein Acr_27g0004170 [Actinidia rufa]|uniref:Nucleolar protein 6 n=1 Tax=Actinidia rufa TaxID=165716 RepID=A0A7J0H6M7_9ERIC|nr:hypothetical protein Acr_27g0004170 [Actinidia rufa]